LINSTDFCANRNNKEPEISVIVPVYGVENYLARCVDSILTQTFTDFELILVDDGSPDGCPAICDEYAQKDNRIKVIHKENGGVSSARNAGLNIASGEYIVFIDSDDYVDCDYLSTLIQYDADVVVSGQETVNGLHTIQEVREQFYHWGGFSGPCEKLFRREKVKDIRFREDISIGEDLIYNLQTFSRIEYVYYIPYRGYHIVDNPCSLTRSDSRKYSYGLDEEYQRKWGQIQTEALRDAGIAQANTRTANANGCSVWIYQKIKNYCYRDCPHPYAEKARRIKRQLDGNRNTIMAVKKPTSPKTFAVIKLCTILRSPHIAYLIFKLLIAMGQ